MFSFYSTCSGHRLEKQDAHEIAGVYQLNMLNTFKDVSNLRSARRHLVLALIAEPVHSAWAAVTDELNDDHFGILAARALLGLTCVTVCTDSELGGTCTHECSPFNAPKKGEVVSWDLLRMSRMMRD